jgi:uncharacterized repeat protein (TIGR01451 family)
MRVPLNRRILFLLCLMFALVLAATHNLRTSNARSGAVRAGLSGTSVGQASPTHLPAKMALGPRLPANRVVSPFDWRNHNLLSPAGAAFFAPLVGAVKSAALAPGGDVNGNGSVNPGDTLAYSVVLSNTGADAALNVVFTDTLSTNLTLVPGSVKASPIATNDLYGSIGNVGLNVPAAGGLLANDVDPNGDPLAVVAPIPTTSAQGGALSISSNGAFTYNPPVGFEGIDTFTYTVSDGGQTNTALVTITVSGMIWFIDNNSSCSLSCNGRLSNPFTSLAAFNTANGLSGGLDPDNNDNIFVYESGTQYSGAVSLRTGQKLIGQDATASLAAIAGISVPLFSNPLPIMNSGNATLTNLGSTVTLNTNVTVRGLTINSTTNTGMNDPAGAITGVSVSEVAVASTTGTAVNLSNAGGAFSFISIASNGAVNGILLASTTGSFTVTGTGGPGSGGTIQNSTGDGVSLTSTAAVSLSSINITGSGNHGINASAVNGLTLISCQLTNSGNADNEHGLNLVNATGTVTINGTTFNNAAEDLVHLDNTNTNVTFNVTNSSQFSYPSSISAFAGNAILLIPKGSAAITASIQNAVFTNIRGASALIGAGAAGSNGTQSFTFSNNTVNVTLSGRASGVAVSGQEATTTNITISNNNFSGAGGNGVISLDTNDSATTSGTVAGNIITNPPGVGIFVAGDEASTTRVVVNGNTVTNSGSDGIEAVNFGGAGVSSMDLAVTNNVVNGNNASPAAAFIGGIVFFGFEDSTCLVLRGNNVTGTPADPTRCGGVPCVDYYLEEAGGTTILEEVPNTVKTVADVAYIQSINSPASASVTIFGTIDLSNGAMCAGPIAMFAPQWDKSRDQLGGQPDRASSITAQANVAASGASTPSLLAQLRLWLKPVFTAFSAPQSYVNLNLAFSKAAESIAPTATAAESGFTPARDAELLAPQGANPNKPAQTLLISSKGEYRLVPTAAIPATFAGETITINGTGSGFTLPPGESTTIMFNATISASFTGTSISNTASISGSNFSTVTASVTTTVYQPPTISKAFAASTIPLNGTTTLTLTITNPNIAAITGVSVADTFPAGLEVDAVPAATNTCGGTFAPAPGATSISLSGGSIAASSSCSVSVTVKGTTSGSKTNTTGNVNSTEGGMGNAASANLLVNNPPTITAIPQSVAAGSNAATYNIATVNDAEDGVAGVTFSISSDGVTFGNSATLNGVTVTYVATNGAGTVSASIATTCSATTANFTIKATDTTSQSSTTTLTITVTANPGPTLSYSSPQTLAAGTSTTVTPATGPSDNGSVTTIVVDSVSPGTGLTASVNNSTGVVSLNATLAGSYTVNIKATDNCGAMTVASFTVNVTCPSITVSPETLPNGQVGSSYNQTITAAPAGGNYTFAVTSGALPPGLSLASNGNLTGTPTTTGTYSFTVTATGFGSCTSSRNYSITIGCPTITINTTSLPNTSRGALYNQTISVSPPGSYTFTISSGSLPPGLSLNSSTGVISGTPTTNGSYTFTVTVSAGGSCTASRTYTISVNGQCPNVTQHDTLPNGTVNVAYFGSLAHVTPTNDYIITLQAGTLPPGLAIDNIQKALVGTPTTAGSYTFTLRATAPSGCYDDRIYTVVISSSVAVPSDFDGDHKADPALFRGTQAGWLLSLSGTQTLETPIWGAPGDQIATGDYDGDGKVDLAVFSPTTGEWRIKRSSDGVTVERAWGAETDTPVPGDYDGDGKTDIAVWRSSEGNWRIVNSSDGAEQIVQQWGLDASGLDAVVPVPNDYDGDGKTDLAVFNKLSATWSIRRSSDGAILTEQWGLSNDTPVPGDYDGDGKTDLAVWRGEQGRWLILRSSDNTTQTEVWGASAATFKDVPVPGDYDGDGKIDLAVWRPALGMWYSRNSSDGATRTLRLGEHGDLPVTAARGR